MLTHSEVRIYCPGTRSYLIVPSMDGHRKLLFPVSLRSAQMVLPLSVHSSHCCFLASVYHGLGQALWWVQETEG